MNDILIKRCAALLLLLVFAGLTGCVSLRGGGFGDVRDSGPSQPVDLSHIPDAVPRVEARTIAGNKSPYTVLGKTYYVLFDVERYQEQGVASWYGNKFHGRNTSNGEVYDMYAMTAAHKTLPIPSYVRVQNLENGKQVVVRVNDRGPFHGNRVIDLSYAAAQRLGFAGKGTAPVEVTLINPGQPVAKPTLILAENTATALAPVNNGARYDKTTTYAQAGAFSSETSAINLRNKLSSVLNYPVFIEGVDAATRVFRVRIGPILDELEFVNIQQIMANHNLGAPHLVRD